MNSILRSVLTLSVFIFGIANQLSAQKSEDQLFVFDKDWKATDVKKAKYLLRIKQLDDSSWQWDTYNILGPLIRVEHFKDRNGEIAEGEVVFFNAKGTIDSVHNYKNGLADGEWQYTNDTGRMVFAKVYTAGRLIRTKDLIKEDDSLEKIKPKVLEGEEVESEFPEGAKGWGSYLAKNLRYPERALKNEIQGKVWVQFIVDTLGNVISPEIARSVEFSIDEEALRLIKQSPKWIPATQKGRKVKSYKRQPIIFRLE